MKVAVVAIVAVVLAMLIFLGGMWIGSRSNDPVSNSEVSAKVEQESSGLHKRLDSVDAKLDILLNIATNGVGRDFRR
jgi:hypothetical protein